jgi:hypothetical protein
VGPLVNVGNAVQRLFRDIFTGARKMSNVSKQSRPRRVGKVGSLIVFNVVCFGVGVCLTLRA